jgi:hypothetical protein
LARAVAIAALGILVLAAIAAWLTIGGVVPGVIAALGVLALLRVAGLLQPFIGRFQSQAVDPKSAVNNEERYDPLAERYPGEMLGGLTSMDPLSRWYTPRSEEMKIESFAEHDSRTRDY